jgi:hypothetical protein
MSNIEKWEVIGIIGVIVGGIVIVIMLITLWKMWKSWIEPNGVKQIKGENRRKKGRGEKRNGHKIHK